MKIRREEADRQQAIRNREGRERLYDAETDSALLEHRLALDEYARLRDVPEPKVLSPCPKHPSWQPVLRPGQPLPPESFCPRCKQDLLDARTSSPKDEEVAVHPRTAELPTTAQAERVWAKLREQLDRSDVEPPKDTVNHELWMKVQHFKRANPWATFEEVVAFREALLLERINERRDLEQEQELREQRGRRPRPPKGLGRPFGVFEPESVVW